MYPYEFLLGSCGEGERQMVGRFYDKDGIQSFSLKQNISMCVWNQAKEAIMVLML